MDGGIGTRGPGETQIETDRRLARDRIAALKRKLAHVRSSRSVMRAERERAHLPSVALAGYTNAGKSTLLNALTGADAGVGDRLFHTLDPTTRVLRAGGRDYLLTDTVGFIRKLPHQLVEAFGATLEETRLADLILHVVDASVPEEELLGDDQPPSRTCCSRSAPSEAPRLLVLGKADLIDEERRAELANRHRDGVLVSALTGEGLGELVERIEDEFARTLREVELLIPFDEGGRLAELHELAGDLEREDTPTACGSSSGCRRPSRRAISRSRSTGTADERAAGPPPGRAREAAHARVSGRCGAGPVRARRRARSGPASGSRCEPGSRSRFPTARPAWCCRAPGSPPATGSRSSTRPG